MKSLVTQYHALNILDLARGGYLYPFSKYDWVWRTNKGTNQTTVTITVLTDVGGTALFKVLGSIGSFDATGARELSGTLPPGLSGLQLTFRAWALNGAGRLIDSAEEVFTAK